MFSTYESNSKFVAFIAMGKFEEACVRAGVAFCEFWHMKSPVVYLLEKHACERMVK